MEILKYHILAFVIGYVLDLIIGDPHGMPHVIRLIGKLISSVEKKIYRDSRTAGLTLVIIVEAIVVIATFAICYGAFLVSPAVGIIIEAVLSFYCIATKSLVTESKAVADADTVEDARYKLSMIVGRDTDNLDEEKIYKATVETVAENTSDGVVAPLLYLCIGGPVLGLFYKACNTMDSMVGYKNDRYMNFGFCAAKFDDVLNFIPSRISALLIIISSYILHGFNGHDAYKIWKRDRRNHKSPNSAQSESAFAGAMGLKLAGGAFYFGKWVDKPFIGDEKKKTEKEDVYKSHKLLLVTSILCEVICTAVIFIIIKLNMIFQLM